jgi:hypothetical protein
VSNNTSAASQATDCGLLCPRSYGGAGGLSRSSGVSRLRVGGKHPNPGRPNKTHTLLSRRAPTVAAG